MTETQRRVHWLDRLECFLFCHDWSFDFVDCVRCGKKGPGYQRWQQATKPWSCSPHYDGRTQRITDEGRREVWDSGVREWRDLHDTAPTRRINDDGQREVWTGREWIADDK